MPARLRRSIMNDTRTGAAVDSGAGTDRRGATSADILSSFKRRLQWAWNARSGASGDTVRPAMRS